VARVNPTEFAILGLVAEGPRSGYDIKKEVEERLSHFWSESYGHIYPMLRRLHARGLLDRTLERQEGRPDRKVYSLTDGGRKALEDWFAEPPPSQRPRNELLLRIFLGRHTRPEHLLRDVRNHREGVMKALARLRAVERRLDAEASAHPDLVYWKLTLGYGLKAFEALAEWGGEAEAALKAMAKRGSEGED
jgi:PadR family transcriptional regulator, regulatory protein AphA